MGVAPGSLLVIPGMGRKGAVELKGIDVHVHPQTEEVIKAAGERGTQMARYFGRGERKPVFFAEMADR